MNNRYGNGFTDLPFGGESDISCRHGFGNSSIPTGLGVTGSGEYRAFSNACTKEITFGDALQIVTVYVFYGIGVSIVVDFVYIFAECIGNGVADRESGSKAFSGRSQEVLCQIQFFKRKGNKGFSYFFVGFTVHVHHLVYNGHVGTDCLQNDADFHISNTHRGGQLANGNIFAVLENCITFQFVFGIL